VKIEFETTNAAFGEEGDAGKFEFAEEIERILLRIARLVDTGCTDGTIRDLNGNTVGTWAL
jgi:hypothetical protein